MFFVHISVFLYMHAHFVSFFFFLPPGSSVNSACNETFRSRPGSLGNVLRALKLRAVSRVGTYI